MPKTSQRTFAGIGVEHVGDGNIGVPELAASRVNTMGRADLAAELLAQSVQRFVAFDAILTEPGDQTLEHFLATVVAVADTGLRLGI